jgi:hypothetical protein
MSLTRDAVAGISSEVGKTTLLCELLREFPGWEAIKMTRGHYRSCGKDPHACCVSHLLGDEPLVRSGFQQTYASDKDTGRYWDAGATNVHWVIVTNEQVERGIELALERVRAPGIFIEGNSFLHLIDVDFAVLVTVAVLGLGGLGHLAVQFAAKMGFKTVAIARGSDKELLAKKLGAHHYIDSQAQDVAGELLRAGGASIILATVTNAQAMSAALGGLGINGKLMVLGAPHEPLEVPAFLLIGGRRSVAGWYSGTSIDSQDTLSFSRLSGVRAMTEVFPLERAPEAYERMMSGKARFRVVLTTGQ